MFTVPGKDIWAVGGDNVSGLLLTGGSPGADSATGVADTSSSTETHTRNAFVLMMFIINPPFNLEKHNFRAVQFSFSLVEITAGWTHSLLLTTLKAG